MPEGTGRRGGALLLGLPPAPNVITLVRTVGAMALAGWAAATGSLTLLVVGYAVYWVGDMADGAVARWREEKTRHGAVLDIVSDRACTTMLATAFLERFSAENGRQLEGFSGSKALIGSPP